MSAWLQVLGVGNMFWLRCQEQLLPGWLFKSSHDLAQTPTVHQLERDSFEVMPKSLSPVAL